MFLSYAPSLSEPVAGARGARGGGVDIGGGGWRAAGPRQLLSDGKTGLWLGPHAGWNCPGQPRNQIINSDTRHSVSWLGLAWKFWYGSISNLSPSSQSPKASLICVYVYVKELRHPCYPNTHIHIHTVPPPPTPALSGCWMGASHRHLLNQVPTLLTSKKIASCTSILPLKSLNQPEDHSSDLKENQLSYLIVYKHWLIYLVREWPDNIWHGLFKHHFLQKSYQGNVEQIASHLCPKILFYSTQCYIEHCLVTDFTVW